MVQNTKPGLSQDGVPTELPFRKFLAWLDEGKDSSGQKYLDMRGRLVRYFDRRNCFPADDLADETLNRVWSNNWKVLRRRRFQLPARLPVSPAW
jgi:hypothetical protein